MAMNEVELKVQPAAAVPQPGHGQVLIRVLAAPINPSDYGTWRGADGELSSPQPCGKEGIGVVVASGGGQQARKLVGRAVGFLGPSLAEYAVADARMCMPLDGVAEAADGASWCINPFTAYAIWDTACSRGATAIVHTGAASQLGQMLVQLCAAKGLTLINVVRRAEQATMLRALGAVHVV
eukprot:4944812-Prymnesium_polylepis.1